ncbi:MAG: hypothetical protein IJH90_09915 [Mogibacterium sp.]|nr:hypothetical protein [Mogibacterium sp.]
MQDINKLIADITDGARAAHAFAVEGRAGEARAAFIRQLAQGLECQAASVRARPCGVCPSCRQIAAGTSLDVIHMNKSQGSGRTARATYKVDDAGAFIERLGMGEYGRFLIGIIDDADSLSEVVQNKLLKTLEEPGPNTILLLGVSNRDNLLSTVRSRCSDIRMSDYAGFHADRSGNDTERPDSGNTGSSADPAQQAMQDIVRMLLDRKTAFHSYRTAIDKNIKSREEALSLLDLFEDELREQLFPDSGTAAHAPGISLTPASAAACIELASVARMDMQNEMQFGKALRRLFLELR